MRLHFALGDKICHGTVLIYNTRSSGESWNAYFCLFQVFAKDEQKVQPCPELPSQSRPCAIACHVFDCRVDLDARTTVRSTFAI